jgi:mannose-6-phosphate isomerase-like protein (cupin superfamily)
MPIVRLKDVPTATANQPGIKSVILKKAIGSNARDPNFSMPTNTESLSVTHIKISGRHNPIKCDESDRAMFVLAGSATVQVGNEPTERITNGDLVVIPKGTPYVFEGDFTYLSISSPAYREGSDIDV